MLGGSGPARAEVEKRVQSWGSQMELADEHEPAADKSILAATLPSV